MPKDAIFLVDESGGLRRMNEGPYASEEILQSLLAKYPDLLAGHQMDRDNPRRWKLIAREMGLAHEAGGTARWSVDHLFVDQDGIPTIIEVKRASDTRIRREVVGQMLDYAANGAVTWDIATLQGRWLASVDNDQNRADRELTEFLSEGGVTPDQFWNTVEQNLRIGNIRMVFVADEIPTELRRIVEFLAIQMKPARVLAVEVKNYESSGAGPNLRTLVPRVIGEPELTKASKSSGPTVSYENALESGGEHVQRVARLLNQWVAENGYFSRTSPSALVVETPPGNRVLRFYPGWDYVEMPLTPLRKAGLTAEADQILRDLRQFVGRDLTEKYPSVPCEAISERWEEFHSNILQPYVGARQTAFTISGATEA